MNRTWLYLGLVIQVSLSCSAVAADSDSTEQASLVEKYMGTFCVTDLGLGGRGGTIQADGSVKFLHLISRNQQLDERRYEVSSAEMYSIWREAYMQSLTVEELRVLIQFCRPENESLRSALKTQRKIGTARALRAAIQSDMKRFPSRDPSLKIFESIAIAEERRYELSPTERQALADLNESPIAKNAITKINDSVRKQVNAKLWQIGKERGLDTPRH